MPKLKPPRAQIFNSVVAVVPALTVAWMLWGIPAEATLIDRGNGIIFDVDRNISWLKDANFAKTSGFNADGVMTWNEARSFVANLVFAGFHDWRLPSALNPDGSGPCAGFNCSGSELGHLLFVEAPQSPGMFINFQPGIYWSGTEASATGAWAFDFFGGRQGTLEKDLVDPLTGEKVLLIDPGPFVLPIRDGDSPFQASEPSTIVLVTSGLAALGGMTWRRHRRK